METKETKQLQINELTMYQQVALEGEVAGLLYDITDETERKYLAFIKLALCEEKYLLVYKNEFKKYLDEDVVNDLVRYRYMELIPVYLYVDKFIKEIKGMLGASCGNMKVLKYPVEVVKSKFIMVMRELLEYIPVTAKAILDGICRECSDDLDFIRPLGFALLQEAQIDVIEQRVGFDVKVKILSTPMDKACITTLAVEEERLKRIARTANLSQEEIVKNCMDTLTSAVKGTIEAIMEAEQESAVQEKLIYLVKKIDRATGQIVFTKEFETQEEAKNYIKGVVKDYPDIIKRFNFAVELVEVA